MKKTVWKKGDTFYYKIESEKLELNNRYLLFIKQDDKQWYNKSIPLFRVLITDYNKLPNTKEEIEKLEHVQTGFKEWETRFLPGVGGIPLYELIKERNKTKFYPDEYGYLNLYQTYIYTKKERTKPIDWTYLGNFEIDSKPQREFIPFSIDNLYYYTWEFQKKDLIECYWNYNLKNSIVYTHDRNLEIRKNGFKLMYPVVTFDIKDEAKREEIFKLITTIDEDSKNNEL